MTGKQFFLQTNTKTFSFPKKSLRNVFQNVSIVVNLALKFFMSCLQLMQISLFEGEVLGVGLLIT